MTLTSDGQPLPQRYWAVLTIALMLASSALLALNRYLPGERS